MKSFKGFTLIELLVVIAIIGVLSTLGGAGASMVQKQAKKTQTATIMQNVSMALEAYKTDMGIYPQTDDSKEIANALTGFTSEPDKRDDKYYKNPNWKGPYYSTDRKGFVNRMNNNAIADAWGNPLNFNITAPQWNPYKFDIWSSGPNGENDKGLKDDVRP